MYLIFISQKSTVFTEGIKEIVQSSDTLSNIPRFLYFSPSS